jgi:hypothetical protein
LAERIDLSAAGYVVFFGSLLMGWVSNRLRRRLVDEFSPNERRILRRPSLRNSRSVERELKVQVERQLVFDTIALCD